MSWMAELDIASEKLLQNEIRWREARAAVVNLLAVMFAGEQMTDPDMETDALFTPVLKAFEITPDELVHRWSAWKATWGDDGP